VLDPYELVTNPCTVELIRIKARKICGLRGFPHRDLEDLEQDMSLYLFGKAHLFDPARGRLEAFVTCALKSWVGMRRRYLKRDKRRLDLDAISLERTMIEADGDQVSLRSVVGGADADRRLGIDRAAEAERIDLADAIGVLWKRLDRHQRTVLLHLAQRGGPDVARILSTRFRRRVALRHTKTVIEAIRDLARDSGLGHT